MFRHPLMALLLAASVVPSAAAGGLAASQTVERQVRISQPDGEVLIRWEPAGRASPGDQLRYSMTWRNESSQPAGNVVLSVPVPAEMKYLENSASADSAVVTYSADGGASFAPRGSLTITADGTTRAALSEEITHVRWSFTSDIPPDAEGVLRFSVVLR